MKKRLFIVAFVIAALVSAWGIFRLFAGAPVEVVQPARGKAVQAVYATGTVEATVMLPISPRITARLAALNVDEGARVTKDQELARLEDEDMQSALKQFEAQEELARKNFDRSAELVKKGFTPKAEYDRAKSALDAAKAATEKARSESQFTKLLAPADGLIIKRDGEIGQLIRAGDPLFWISCCAPLRISTEVDEEDIAQVQPGQKVLIRADAFPGKIFQGKVQAITPKGDPVARSYRVRVEFTEPNPLLIGMTAETNIIVRETDEALLVPAGAVTLGRLWVIRGGKLTQVPVELGAKGQDKVEVTGGIEPSDMVVLKPTDKLKEGQRARSNLVRWTPP